MTISGPSSDWTPVEGESDVSDSGFDDAPSASDLIECARSKRDVPDTLDYPIVSDATPEHQLPSVVIDPMGPEARLMETRRMLLFNGVKPADLQRYERQVANGEDPRFREVKYKIEVDNMVAGYLETYRTVLDMFETNSDIDGESQH